MSQSLPPGPPLTSASPPTVVEIKTGPNILIRAIWFIFIGWWLSGVVAGIAWLAMITIIGLPLGIYLVNRLPTVISLRPRTSYAYAFTDAYGAVHTSPAGSIDQPPWWVRFIWFIFIGSWASFATMLIAWILILLVITIPLGLALFNRVPFVASLYRY